MSKQVDLPAFDNSELSTTTWPWRISLEQLIKADKQLWTEMSKVYTGAVLAAVGQNEPPLDEHILRLRNDPRVTMYLLPLPVMNKAATGAPSSGSGVGPVKVSPKRNPRKVQGDKES